METSELKNKEEDDRDEDEEGCSGSIRIGTALKKVTFDFFGGLDIFCVPLQGADQGADVRQVNFTANQVLQTLQAVLPLQARPRLQVSDDGLKGLKHREQAEPGTGLGPEPDCVSRRALRDAAGEDRVGARAC